MAGRRYGDWDNENEERLEREAERRRLEAEKREAEKLIADQSQVVVATQEKVVPETPVQTRAKIEREVIVDNTDPILFQSFNEQPYRIYEGADGQLSFFAFTMPARKGSNKKAVEIRTSRPFVDVDTENESF